MFDRQEIFFRITSAIEILVSVQGDSPIIDTLNGQRFNIKFGNSTIQCQISLWAIELGLDAESSVPN